jgi:hypothetical protein
MWYRYRACGTGDILMMLYSCISEYENPVYNFVLRNKIKDFEANVSNMETRLYIARVSTFRKGVLDAVRSGASLIVLYPQKTELVTTAKLPLRGLGSIVHLRESDKGTICSPNSNFIAFPIIYIYI